MSPLTLSKLLWSFAVSSGLSLPFSLAFSFAFVRATLDSPYLNFSASLAVT